MVYSEVRGNKEMSYEMMARMGHHGGIYWIFLLFRRVLGFILPFLLLYLIYIFIKEKKSSVEKKLETPTERLKMRLAKGEITKKEYEDLKSIIEGKK